MKLLHKLIGTGLNLSSLVVPNWTTNKLIEIFSTPERPNVRPKDKDFLATAKVLKVNRNGHDIVEYHWGRRGAPLIVLSYGWSYNAGRWRHFVKDLVAAGYCCIAYDPVGHGNAPKGLLNLPINAGFIRAIIEDYGSAEAVLAHSFGGTSAVYAVHDLPRPLRPQKLIVMASFSNTPSVFSAFSEQLGLWDRTFGRMVTKFEERIGKPLSFFDLALMTSNMADIQGLIVHSIEDKVTPFRSALRYHSYWSGSFLYAPKNGGHHLGTSEITRAILDFIILDKIPAGAEKQERPANRNHELEQYFVGL